jgi:carbon starvation protein
VEKVFSPNPAIGFVAHALRFGSAMAAGTVLAPAKTMQQMSQIVFNDYVDATLAGVFAAVVVTMVIYGITHCRKAMDTPTSTTHEVGPGMLAAAGDD